MGIKFHCPKGHKLNVKDFLAGKKGACPHCGAQFMIPLQSQPKGDRTPVPELVGAEAEAGAELPVATVPTTAGSPGVVGATTGMPATVSPTASTASFPATPMPAANAFAGLAPAAVIPASSGSVPVGVPVSPARVGPAVAAPAAVAVAAPAPSVPAFAPVVRPATPDPIDESPQAVWYVRPPSGGQYGPAKGDVMRRWAAEGRVSADSLVWREGWADWKPANQVFPSLAIPPAPSPVGSPAPVSLGLGGGPAGIAVSSPSSVDAPLTGTPRGAAQPRRKSGNSMGLVIVIMLGLMAVILLAALLYIVMRA